VGKPKKDRRKEHYYREAKRRGYRARSAFKLKQMIRRFNLLNGVDKVVELCSSPGGWTQVLREMDKTLEIVAVDLVPMRPIEGVKFVQGDITDEGIVQQITRLTGGDVDLIVADCSPKVSGYWELDVARQLALAERTVELGQLLLGPNGMVVTKVFQGPGFSEFVRSVRERFATVKLVKPHASRQTSAEIYLLAIGPKEARGPETSQGE